MRVANNSGKGPNQNKIQPNSLSAFDLMNKIVILLTLVVY